MDVEILIEMERRHWPESWKRVDVYRDEVIVSKLESSDHNSESDDAFFTRVFGNYYDEEAKAVHIRDFSLVLPVICEYEDGERH